MSPEKTTDSSLGGLGGKTHTTLLRGGNARRGYNKLKKPEYRKIKLSDNVKVTKRGRGRPRIYDRHGNRLDGKPGKRNETTGLKRKYRELVASNKANEVHQSETELPYRGMFNFEDGNTFTNRPDVEFRRLFRRLERKSNRKQDPSDENSILDGKPYHVHLGDKSFNAWFKSPYPPEISRYSQLYICQYCFRYFGSQFSLTRHNLKCPCFHHPPGTEIYRDGELSVFEVDGRKNAIYCQNLCLFAKLFLNSKTLYYDVEPFMFYVLCSFDRHKSGNNHRFLGYFSKEKLTASNYNLSCIMTLPIYQRKGYGTFLIDFSYLLSRREFKLGTPEKPLSDLGLLSYRNYWKLSVARAINHIVKSLSADKVNRLSIDDLSNLTGMTYNDVIVGLEELQSLVYDSETEKYGLVLNMLVIRQQLEAWNEKNYIKVKPELLIWKPVILGPSGGINTTTKMVITDRNPEPDSDPQVVTTKATSSSSFNTSEKYDEKGNSLMSDISLITNFLRDDLEDDRDLEVQALEKIKKSQTGTEYNFDHSRICFPGIFKHK